MSYLYIDIETIPVQSEERKQDVLANLSPPKSYKKEETIAKWREEAEATAIGKTSFDGAYGEVCCICWAHDDGEVFRAYRDEVQPEENQTIKSFFRKSAAEIGPYRPIIVGHRVAGFDLNFLRKRSMVLGIKMPTFLPRDLKPWSPEIFDTQQQWDSQSMISLDNLAKTLGIRGKGEVDGSMVAEMYADKKFEEIANYCASDVELTRRVHQKMMKAL